MQACRTHSIIREIIKAHGFALATEWTRARTPDPFYCANFTYLNYVWQQRGAVVRVTTAHRHRAPLTAEA